MNRNAYSFCFLALTLAGLAGCSSEPAAKESKAAPARDKIQGKAQVIEESAASEAALNAGGPSVDLVDGLRRYRLFFKTAVPVVAGKQYVAEGVYAQKAIDEMGDPDQGKNGYPLASSCERVVKMAWSGLPFDVADGHTSVLRTKVKRYPARAIFLVTRLDLVTSDKDPKKDAEGEEKEVPEVSVPADKQRALLIEGPSVQPAPLWEPAGGTVRCKVVIDTKGKVSELETGAQLCEATPWSQFRYQPPVQGGHPVKVKTEVEVRYEPRK
jgi:hypothetical protein